MVSLFFINNLFSEILNKEEYAKGLSDWEIKITEYKKKNTEQHYEKFKMFNEKFLHDLSNKEVLEVYKAYQTLVKAQWDFFLRNDNTLLKYVEDRSKSKNKLIRSEANWALYMKTEKIEFAVKSLQDNPALFVAFETLKDSNFNKTFKIFLDMEIWEEWSRFDSYLGYTSNSRVGVLISNHNDSRQYKILLSLYLDRYFETNKTIPKKIILKYPKKSKEFVKLLVNKLVSLGHYESLMDLYLFLDKENLSDLKFLVDVEVKSMEAKVKKFETFNSSLKLLKESK